MNRHRLVLASKLEIRSAIKPFSSFRFVEERFKSINSGRRCFSLARSLGMKTITIEEIPCSGIIADENNEISTYFEDYRCEGLIRLGFWKKSFYRSNQMKTLSAHDLIGYVILKHDVSDLANYDCWHLFDAVFIKYPHPHNCIPDSKSYEVMLGETRYSLQGVLYCQQNTLNKSCAHVALRSLLSKHLQGDDILYSKINCLAGIYPGNGKRPGSGMTTAQIRNVLDGCKIQYRDIDYTLDKCLRKTHPYQKFLYAGIESGAGALLGFHLSGPDVPSSEPPCHIIPFFGHTFNKDTWVTDAELSYFNIGGGMEYVPSENWTSSFIGHDDNFGPNYCVPRLYVTQEYADYVVELFNESAQYSGVQAEAVTLNFIYSLQSSINKSSDNNYWIKKLVEYIRRKQIVLRAIYITKSTYLKQLDSIADWDGNKERKSIVSSLRELLPDKIWVVEISFPQLFPANERKIGEVLLNPYIAIDIKYNVDFRLFLLARIPNQYYFLKSFKKTKPDFIEVISKIQSHMPLIKHE